MIDENLEREIEKHRESARALGEAAMEAILSGDAGLARSAARQAAQWARVVMQLESGEKQSFEEAESSRSAAHDSGSMAV